METIPFVGKIRRSANVYIVTVPKKYVDNKLLLEGEEYLFQALDERQKNLKDALYGISSRELSIV